MLSRSVWQWIERSVDLGSHQRTWRHRRQAAEGRLPTRPSRATPAAEHRVHPARIPDPDRAVIRGVLCEQRFVDLAPAQVYATLLDEGTYLYSERTMYRILHEDDLVGERRRGHRRRPKAAPRVHATAPNQVWSDDIERHEALTNPAVMKGHRRPARRSERDEAEGSPIRGTPEKGWKQP